MKPDQQRLSQAERANLVAYLDQELNEAEAHAIATKLTLSVSARREVDALEKTWELLDYLPRPKATPELTERTLAEAGQVASLDGQLVVVANQLARKVVR